MASATWFDIITNLLLCAITGLLVLVTWWLKSVTQSSFTTPVLEARIAENWVDFKYEFRNAGKGVAIIMGQELHGTGGRLDAWDSATRAVVGPGETFTIEFKLKNDNDMPEFTDTWSVLVSYCDVYGREFSIRVFFRFYEENYGEHCIAYGGYRKNHTIESLKAGASLP